MGCHKSRVTVKTKKKKTYQKLCKSFWCWENKVLKIFRYTPICMQINLPLLPSLRDGFCCCCCICGPFFSSFGALATGTIGLFPSQACSKLLGIGFANGIFFCGSLLRSSCLKKGESMFQSKPGIFGSSSYSLSSVKNKVHILQLADKKSLCEISVKSTPKLKTYP